MTARRQNYKVIDMQAGRFQMFSVTYYLTHSQMTRHEGSNAHNDPVLIGVDTKKEPHST